MIRHLQLSEPVRLYVGGVLGTLVALLVGYGVLDGDTAALWLAVATALLAVPTVEATRSIVTPVGRARQAVAVARAEGYLQARHDTRGAAESVTEHKPAGS